jgi:GntR family transcriptional regulator
MSRLPLYIQVAQRLVDYIEENPDPASGNKLPPEERLPDILDASRNTVREALMYLERGGVITKRQGSGNFFHRSVLDVRAHVDTAISFAEVISRKGLEPSATPLSVIDHRTDSAMAQNLLLPNNTVFQVLERSYLANGQLAVYCLNFVPRDAISNPKSDAYLGSIFAFLKECCGQDLCHTIEEISTKSATAQIASVLHVPEGHAVMVWEETHYNVSDQAVAVTMAYMNSDLTRLVLLHKLS